MGTAGWPDGVDPKLPFLGGPFLSQVYLVVDYETGVFSMAPINRGAASTASKSLVTLGCDTENGPKPSMDPSPLEDSRKKSNLAPIVGGVVGGVSMIALLAAVFIFRRRRRGDPNAPIDATALPLPTKEQSEAHHGFHHQPYDAPPAFSPSPSPGPYSPPNSPGPYMGMAAVPRRPLPGQEYPQTGSPPGGYYDNQQGYNMTNRVSEPVELKGTDVYSELSGSQPQSYSGAYEGGSVVSGQTSNR